MRETQTENEERNASVEGITQQCLGASRLASYRSIPGHAQFHGSSLAEGRNACSSGGPERGCRSRRIEPVATADRRRDGRCSCCHARFGFIERLAGFYRYKEEQQDFSAATHLALPPALRESPLLSAHQLDEIANRFQPRLLRFRLEHYRNVGEPRPGPSPLNLPACVEENSDFVQAVKPLLQRQQEDALARQGPDVRVAVIEVLWPLCHEISEIGVGQLTGLTNTLLRDRRETLEFSAEEIGWCLRNLGLYRHRSADGMFLRFSREQITRIHQAASHLGLTLPLVDGCPDCNPRESSVAQSVVKGM
jgi:hypothetical protein